ncbi:DEAD/DEAH box helicase [Terasakiella sp.]|uniref:DEAD/DEAH box helicase n=1 Tax=Terasakiella sp. TaxID=2034861 RepID=UPI003AA8A794
MAIELRGYQGRLVTDARDSFAAKHRAVLVVLPTGGGKTFIFCYIADATQKKGNNVLILVHRKELIRQTSKSLTKLGVDHGVIAPGHPFQLKKQVQVASIQTVGRRLDVLAKSGWVPGLIVPDEAHHATAGTWRKVIDHWPNARVLGVTATPCRTDGVGLGLEAGGVFNVMVDGPQIADLIAEGHLVEPVVYAPPVAADLSGMKKQAGDFSKKDQAARMDKPKVTGDAVDHYARICPGQPGIAFCVSVEHAQHVAEQFRAAGWRSVALHADMPADERDKAIKDLAEGRLDVLTSCDIVSEGTDIPVASVAILLRRTNSLSLYLQQVGRVLRTHPGKTCGIILDHVGNWELHGMPDDHREWSLEGKPKGSRAANDNGPPPPINCKGCYRQVRLPAPPACPHCGLALPKAKDRMDGLEVVDGELTRITAADKKAATTKRNHEQAAAKGISELTKLAVDRGYKSPQRWAARVHAGRMAKRMNSGL